MLGNKWRLSARSVFLLYSVTNSLFLGTIFTVDLVYQVQVAHLTPLQLVLVGTFKVRATVFSMMGEMNALGQIAGGPPVGYIGTVFSLRAALTTVSIILSPVLLLFAYAARKVKAEQAEDVSISAKNASQR